MRDLAIEHLGSDRCLPEPLQGDRLLQVRPDLALDHISWDRDLEGLRGADLVAVVDALDRLLGPNALLERQLAREARERRDQDHTEDEAGESLIHGSPQGESVPTGYR
jgi:hypothetical protein